MNMQAIQKLNDTYQRLDDALYKRMIASIVHADPRLGNEQASGYVFLCCHNWGNEKSVKIMRHFEAVRSYLCQRKDREWLILCHNEHIAENRAGDYLWCNFCKNQK